VYLDAIRRQHPTNITMPAKIWPYSYSPPFLWISSPAIGGPVNVAKLKIVNTIPILVPAILKSVVKLERAVGKRLWIAAPTIP
jgi:hypothetical protein